MVTAKNPILSGFYPDPSICRAGEDYYIVNSSFVYAPGVPIFHSRDLAHWEQIGNILDRPEQLPVKGSEISQGIYAPTIRFHDGLFYMITTNVSYGGNFIVTAKDPAGPWSDPYYLGEDAPGIDPSLFFDDDGKCYYCGTRPNPEGVRYNGDWEIWVQELDFRQMKLVGESMAIWKGAVKGVIWPEGPHLYKIDGYYYLMTAEGGTGYHHAVTVARSRNIDGPYEVAPNTPMLTSRYFPTHELQKAGHGSLVETPDHQWYLAHLCSRPVGQERRCILGRETAIQKVKWVEDWPVLEDGTCLPQMEVAAPMAGNQKNNTEEGKVRDGVEAKEIDMSGPWFYEDFDGDTWSLHLQSLRIPLDDRASLTDRPGWLRLYGAESLNSHFTQSLLGCRQQSFYMEAETKVEFQPENFKQMAGLAYYYNTQCYYYLHITRDDQFGRILSIIKNDLGKGSYPIGMGVPIPEKDPVWLKLTTRKETAQFSYALDGENYREIGEPLDATILSDDYFDQTGHGMFTGAFVAICCQDTSGERKAADFDWIRVNMIV